MKDNVSLVNLYEIVEIEENRLQLAELLVQCTTTEVCCSEIELYLLEHYCKNYLYLYE